MSSEPHPRQGISQVFIRLTVLLALANYICARLIIPQLRPATYDPYPTTAWQAPLALTAACGLALPLVCLWSNRAKLRSLIKPTRGRILSAVMLAGFSPFASLYYIPISIGGYAGLNLFDFVENPLWRKLPWLLLIQGLMIAASLVAYPLACAMIYGLVRKWRIPAFILLILGLWAQFYLWGFSFVGPI